jgi:hypothetical protein
VKKLELNFKQLLDQMPFVAGVLTIAEEQWKVQPKNPAYAETVTLPPVPETITPVPETKPEVSETLSPIEQPEPVPAEPAPIIEQLEPVPAAAAATPARTKSDVFQYKLKDGRGPFTTIQEAMDAMGLDKNARPTHNRYDRLSKKLQGEIIQEKKQERHEKR